MEVVEEEVVPASPTSAEDEAWSVPEAAGITDSNFCFNASKEASGLQKNHENINNLENEFFFGNSFFPRLHFLKIRGENHILFSS